MHAFPHVLLREGERPFLFGFRVDRFLVSGENETMSEGENERQWKGQTLLGVHLFVLFYFLSIGPAEAIFMNVDSDLLDTFFRVFYAPIFWLYDHTPCQGMIDEYCDFWWDIFN